MLDNVTSETLEALAEKARKGNAAEALATLDQMFEEEPRDGLIPAMLARVAALAGDKERLARASAWLVERKGKIPPEFAAEGYFWRSDLLTAQRTLEAATRSRNASAGVWYLLALIHYLQDEVAEAYHSLRHFATIDEEREVRGEPEDDPGRDLLARASLDQDRLEDFRLLQADAETEVTDGKAMGLRLSRLSEEIEKAVWVKEKRRGQFPLNLALQRLAGQMEAKRPLTVKQAEKFLESTARLISSVTMDEEILRAWEQRDLATVADVIIDYMAGQLGLEDDASESGKSKLEETTFTQFAQILPLAALRPLVYVMTLARFPDREAVDKLLQERRDDFVRLLGMATMAFVTSVNQGKIKLRRE